MREGSMATSFSSMAVARNQRCGVLLRTGVSFSLRSQAKKSRSKAIGSEQWPPSK